MNKQKITPKSTSSAKIQAKRFCGILSAIDCWGRWVVRTWRGKWRWKAQRVRCGASAALRGPQGVRCGANATHFPSSSAAFFLLAAPGMAAKSRERCPARPTRNTLKRKRRRRSPNAPRISKTLKNHRKLWKISRNFKNLQNLDFSWKSRKWAKK